jgi:hypothetical protein
MSSRPSSVSHDNVTRLVTDRSMCFATALEKAFENKRDPSLPGKESLL